MRYLLLVLILLCSSCTGTPQPQSQAASGAKPVPARSYAQSLATLVRKGEAAQTRDFSALRESYFNSPAYRPYLAAEDEDIRSAFAAMKSSDWNRCIAHAQKALDINFTSLFGQYLLMTCSYESAQREQASYHEFMLHGLLGSIAATGDGKSQESAFRTISTTELRAFLQLQGLEIKNQALIQGESGVFDLMGVRDQDSGREFKVYFDITRQWRKGLQASR